MLPNFVTVRSWEVTPLCVSLPEPFVIASGVVTTTQNALVRVELSDASGRLSWGLGEAATLTPVTAEGLPDVLATLRRVGEQLVGKGIEIDERWSALSAVLDERMAGAKVSRAGAETALIDAIARLQGVPVRTLLGGELGAATTTMTSDITIPIRDVETMARLALYHRKQGFRCFKVKVGRDMDHDLAALSAIQRAVRDASFRIDANAGFSAKTACLLVERLLQSGIVIECFEQPCRTLDLAGMAEVAEAIEAPVIADESVTELSDVQRVGDAKAADGVNLKLAKSGGLLQALAIGRAAKERGLLVMCGGMVETRLGMTAAAHVVSALGGVDFVDLDTAWLLSEDRFSGGYAARGPEYTLGEGAGFDVAPKAFPA